MIEIYLGFWQICQEIKDRESIVEVWKKTKNRRRELECLGRVEQAMLGRLVVKTSNGPFTIDWRGSGIRTKFKNGWEIETDAGEVWLLKECRNLVA